MYLGRRFRMFDENHRVFNSGGAAYALNQASLGVLAAHLDDDACHHHAETPWEDVMVRLEGEGLRRSRGSDEAGVEARKKEAREQNKPPLGINAGLLRFVDQRQVPWGMPNGLSLSPS